MNNSSVEIRYYKSLIIKFIKLLMKNGKQSKSEKIVWFMLKSLSEKDNSSPLFVFYKSLKNISPLVIVRSVKVRGRSYQIPIPLKESRQLSIGMKWLIKLCNQIIKTKGGIFSDVLVQQLILAYQNKGEIFKKKSELHKLARSNRIFANFRWF